jgi:phage virion morphogenesis protein
MLEITVDDAGVREALTALQKRLGDLTIPFQDLGESLLNSTRARFDSMAAPDGAPWAPLSPAYQKTKPKHKDLILTLNGYLRGTLAYQASPRALRLGSPMNYAAQHQFGDPARHLPARPFLGLSEADRQEIIATLQDWLLPN